MTSMRIRELRKARGLTGEQLGELVGVSKGYVSELETGRKNPGGRLVLKLAEALEVEVAELFEGEDKAREEAALDAHLEVMRQLSDEDRKAIEKAAIGLLRTPGGSSRAP
ncbi:MAG: helix-turn-helix transcriptional regulator [Pseudomonadota bacterium]|nr:helix-turn-helix transcriptional regulator [Pseudomonadota bacterium]